MYYFEETEQSVVKYKVEIDKEKLEALRLTIIDNCSERTHQIRYRISEKSRYMFSADPYHRNVEFTHVGTQHYNDGPDEDVYNVEYEELKFPEIIRSIDAVLNGDVKDLPQLLYPAEEDNNNNKAKLAVEKLYEKAAHVLNRTMISSVKDITNTIDKLQSIKDSILELERHIELNKHRQLVSDYHLEIISCIHLEKVDEMDIETYREMQSFCSPDFARWLPLRKELEI